MRTLYKIAGLSLFLILFNACASVEKYNAQIAKPVSVTDLRADVDYAYENLKKRHPNLYEFTPENALDKAFDSLKTSLTKPLTGREFYKKLAFVIKKIGQGHTSISPPFRKQTKAEYKKRGKREHPLKPLRFTYLPPHLWIKKVFNKDTALVGAEVLEMENQSVSKLMQTYDSLVASDGYNKTFYPKIKGMYFAHLYANLHERKDTVSLLLRINDSIFTKRFVAKYTKEEDKEKEVDSLATGNTLTKAERKIQKAKRKAREKWEKIHGYDSYTKEVLREFKILDSLAPKTAYLRIRRFKNGRAKKFYQEVFHQIDSLGIENLILDLRGNLGGALHQVDEVLSYLSLERYKVLKQAQMTGRWSYLHPFLHSHNAIVKTLTWLTLPVHSLYFQLFRIRKNQQQVYLKIRQAKYKDPKPNHYKGRLYVLIDGASFSASSILSAHLKATHRATLVGEETGGTFNATVAGIFDYPVLPHLWKLSRYRHCLYDRSF